MDTTINLSYLALSSGDVITVKAKATGYTESDASNAVTWTSYEYTQVGSALTLTNAPYTQTGSVVQIN